MLKTVAPRAISRTQSPRAECCTDPDCGSGLRNNYYDGKRLTPDAFRVEQRYLVQRRHLLNRAIHGWGVVYGYAIAISPSDEGARAPRSRQLTIGAGLALDECGRELVEPGRAITLEDVIVVDERGRPIDGDALSAIMQKVRHTKDRMADVCWQLRAHYAEQGRDHVQVTDPCRCPQHEWDHVCEMVRYTLRPVPCDDCCAGTDCELTCDCASGGCCNAERSPYEATKGHDGRQHAEVLPGRGGCHCLCDHLTMLNPGDDCDDRLCEIEERCGNVHVDLAHGVPLACIAIERDDCGWTFGGEVEACGPRRLVKRNDLLFDLIRGCDLTTITAFGWSAWHRRHEPVSFGEFSEALGPQGSSEDEYVTRDFWVQFSRPVRKATLRPDCFAMTALSAEREGGWWQTSRVPIVAVDTTMLPAEPGDPADCVRGARVVVDGSWIEDGVRGRRSIFLGAETRIEIEVRGDFIIDCNGQPVDANALGLSTVRTGNGTPGGTFLSGFRVAAAREEQDRPRPFDHADRNTGASS